MSNQTLKQHRLLLITKKIKQAIDDRKSPTAKVVNTYLLKLKSAKPLLEIKCPQEREKKKKKKKGRRYSSFGCKYLILNHS
jgi:hypothetical protein